MLGDETRANEFDRWVGRIQAEHSVKYGVGTSVLDIGCGIGEFTPLFLEKFTRVVGLDPSKEYLEEARKNNADIEFVEGWGESFSLDEKFDTISMNNLLEHVNDPVAVLANCKKHLNKGGRIIAMVPNAQSVARRLGVLMGVIPDINFINDKERDFYGHQRVYTLDTLIGDAFKAGLSVIESGGLVYKPLPNEMLLDLCKKQGDEWRDMFMSALIEFGYERPKECAQIFIICE